jgi:predicted ATPase
VRRVVVANNLPLTRTSFIGRDGSVAELGVLVDRSAVVTLAGPGGVGKTRLAIEFARQRLEDYPDGVWLADLAPVDSAEAVATEVAGLFGVTPGAGDLLALLTEYLAARRVLLVLDNCEHVVEDFALLVARLVAACPQLRVLCTSRALLDLGTEADFHVEPLPTSTDAMQLFLERARATAPDIALADADAAAVADICDRLDRLPLAIELSAPWLRIMTPGELLRRLGEGLDVVAGNRRDLPIRQRTIRATVKHSYQLLDSVEQVLFRRLTVFAGSFAVEAVADVCSGAPVDRTVVVELLAGLRDRSMIVVERAADGPTRFRLLEVLRVGWVQEQSRAIAERHRLPARQRNGILGERGAEMLRQQFQPLQENP